MVTSSMSNVTTPKPNVDASKPSLSTGITGAPTAAETTVKVNWVVWVSPPPTPVTMMVKDPGGVEDDVVMVRVAETVGETLQVGWPPQPTPPLNPTEAPVGSPLTLRVTGCVVPLNRVT